MVVALPNLVSATHSIASLHSTYPNETRSPVVMAPKITAWEDLICFDVEVDDETGEYLHSTFAVVDEDDTAHFGKLNHPKDDMTFEQITSALTPIPDEKIFPEWAPYQAELTQARDTPLLPNIFIKRPALYLYSNSQVEYTLNHIRKIST